MALYCRVDGQHSLKLIRVSEIQGVLDGLAGQLEHWAAESKGGGADELTGLAAAFVLAAAERGATAALDRLYAALAAAMWERVSGGGAGCGELAGRVLALGARPLHELFQVAADQLAEFCASDSASYAVLVGYAAAAAAYDGRVAPCGDLAEYLARELAAGRRQAEAAYFLQEAGGALPDGGAALQGLLEGRDGPPRR